MKEINYIYGIYSAFSKKNGLGQIAINSRQI